MATRTVYNPALLKDNVLLLLRSSRCSQRLLDHLRELESPTRYSEGWPLTIVGPGQTPWQSDPRTSVPAVRRNDVATVGAVLETTGVELDKFGDVSSSKLAKIHRPNSSSALRVVLHLVELSLAFSNCLSGLKRLPSTARSAFCDQGLTANDWANGKHRSEKCVEPKKRRRASLSSYADNQIGSILSAVLNLTKMRLPYFELPPRIRSISAIP